MDFVADIADRAMHHLSNMGCREKGRIKTPEFLARVGLTHPPMILNVISGL